MAEEAKPDINVDELRDQLDALWEKHLTLLDSYHQAQQQLARHFSSGFFDLAQATFKSTTRVRYGQEYYDDRMQATRRFKASVDDNDLPLLTLKAEDATPKDINSSNKHSINSTKNSLQHEAPKDKQEMPEQQQPTPPSTPPPDTDTEEKPSEERRAQEKSGPTDDKDKSPKKPRDPLHWYGILVPPSLRASQKSFVSAIESPVIEAANSAQALRHVAVEIRKLRKDIRKAERRVV